MSGDHPLERMVLTAVEDCWIENLRRCVLCQCVSCRASLRIPARLSGLILIAVNLLIDCGVTDEEAAAALGEMVAPAQISEIAHHARLRQLRAAPVQGHG